MIRQIWIRIVALLALALIPATLLQLNLQSESVGLIFDLAERTRIQGDLDEHQALLRGLAREFPDREGEFRKKFDLTSQVRQSVEEFFLARSSIDREIRVQTLMITALVLLVSLLGSLLISRGIVARVSGLMEEQQRAAAKLRDLSALKNWQAVARVLVHELKAPVTPIKLIATDLERKYNSLTPEAFGRYVEDAQKLLAEQVVAIETMIEGFTRFGRLPAPNRRRTNLADFLRDFSSNYGEAFGPGVRLSVTSMAHDMLVDMDAKLMRDLLFNLCKNAGEANQGDTEITMAMTISTTGSGASVEVRNTGAIISEELQDSVFEPYVSTKHDLEKSNMGLGLTIAKKIALDHGGDLILVRDKTFAGTIFRIDLPSAKAAEEKSTGSEETLS